MFDAAQACKRGCVFLSAPSTAFRDTEKALVFKSMLEAKGYALFPPPRSGLRRLAIANMVRTIFLA